MDLFPKDYKKNSPSLTTSGPGAAVADFFNNLKNKLSGNRSFSAPSRAREVFLRLGVIISLTAFVLVVVLWGGMFFYKKSLISQIDDLKKEQAEVFSIQDREAAEKIVSLDKSATLAQTLLKNHVYSTELFDKLAATTLPRVQWRSLDLTVADSSLVLKGFSADYSILAKQILALSEGGFFNVEITNIALDKTGGVSFMANFNFDPKILQK